MRNATARLGYETRDERHSPTRGPIEERRGDDPIRFGAGPRPTFPAPTSLGDRCGGRAAGRRCGDGFLDIGPEFFRQFT